MSLQKTFLAIVAALTLTNSAHAVTFSLAGAVGSSPTFSITSGGVTATFTSPSSNFTVQGTSGLFDFTLALVDKNAAFLGDNLTISFSTPQNNQVVIPFGIEDSYGAIGNDSVTVTTNTGQSFTFGTMLSGLALGEPEGTIKFVPTSAITSLTISSANAYGIGTINVPEPMSLSLLGAGLFGLAASRRRAR